MKIEGICVKGIATKIYPQNKSNGIMICGINHGDSKKDIKDREAGKAYEKSFFSHKNKKVRSFPFKNRIIKWFSLWGHPLYTNENDAGDFEYSIFHTNWIKQRSKNLEELENVKDHFKNDNQLFFDKIKLYKPNLIIFFNAKLVHELNQSRYGQIRNHILGKGNEIADILNRKTDNNSKFRTYIQFYPETSTTIIALPHPNSRVPNKFIESLKEDIDPILEKYKQGMKIHG